MVGWTSSGGGSIGIDGRVSVYADLPDATLNPDKIYLVETATGIIFINYRKAGLYYSNGVSWDFMPNSVQANFVMYDNTTSLLVATNAQSAIDEIKLVPTMYHGVVENPAITDNGNGTINLSAGACNFGVATNGNGLTRRLATPAAANIALTNNAVNYVYADYNAGSPIINVTLTAIIFSNDARLVSLYRVVREGNDLHMLDYDEYGISLADKSFYKDIALNSFERQTGLILSTAATRISTVSAGSAWFGVKVFSLSENKAGVSGELYQYYLTAGVWSSQLVTAYDSTYYSDGTNRQSLGVSKYVAKYFYRGIEVDNHAYYIHGDQKNSLADALTEAVPVTPAVITAHSLYVGKIVIQQNSANGVAYPRAGEGAVISNGAVNHSDLANINPAGPGVTAGHISDGTQIIGGIKTFLSLLISKVSNDSYSYGGSVLLQKSNGTTAAPTALVAGDIFGVIQAGVYNGSAYT